MVKAGCVVGGTGLRGAVIVVMIGLNKISIAAAIQESKGLIKSR